MMRSGTQDTSNRISTATKAIVHPGAAVSRVSAIEAAAPPHGYCPLGQFFTRLAALTLPMPVEKFQVGVVPNAGE